MTELQPTKPKARTLKTVHKCNSCGTVITNRYSIARGTCRVCNDAAQELESFTVTDMVGDLENMLNPDGVTRCPDYEGNYAWTYR